MDNTWTANIVTSGIVGTVVIAVAAYFFKRLISQFDERYLHLEKKQEEEHKSITKKIGDCDDRSDKIEKNYIKRFDDVQKEINQSNNKWGEKLTNEIREITKDKNIADIAQVKEMAEVKGEVKDTKNEIKNLKDRVEQVLRVLK